MIIMKSTKVKLIAFLTGLILILLSCEKVVPIVTTTEITGITDKSATTGGTVTDEGSGPVIERGVCWSSIYEYPTIYDFRTIDSKGAREFISNINNLHSETAYLVRAYATNSIGTGYGEYLSFTTEESPLPPWDPPNPYLIKK